MLESLSEYQKAKKKNTERAVAIAIETGNRREDGRLYGNLGTVFQSLGEYQKAKEHYDKALAIATEMNDKEGEARQNAGSLEMCF